MTITEFLEARIAEDEATAKLALTSGSSLDLEDFEADESYARNVLVIGKDRVLAECAAKRAIIAMDGTSGFMDRYAERGHEAAAAEVLALIAGVYAGHPDYDPEWKV